MGHIIAGRLDVQEHAEALAEAIQGLGINRDKISVFYVNPDGQHHLLPTGATKVPHLAPPKRAKGPGSVVVSALLPVPQPARSPDR